MNTLTLFKRRGRANLACSATLVLAALLSACGGGGGGDGGVGASSIGQAAAPVAVVGSSTAAAAATVAAAPAVAGGANMADVAAPALSAASSCVAPTCAAAPGDGLAALPVYPGAPDAPDGQGYLVASTDLITSAGEPPYPDLRTLPTQILPFRPMAFGDMSAFSVASVH